MIESPVTHTGHILVADDDADICDLIMTMLRRENYTVAAAASISEVRAHIAQHRVDLVILDLNLPDGDGLALCRQIRSEAFEGAVIMVTARDAAIDRVLGLEFGADDYLAKPFEPRELVARVRNLFKRMGRAAARSPNIARIASFGPWRLDLRLRRLLTAGDRIVMLSTAEFELLRRFVESPDRVLSREELLPEGAASTGNDRTMDLQVSRLRQKLASEPSGAGEIITVRNRGYLMPGPVTFQ